MEIKSVIIYKNDFENLLEMDKTERSEIIEGILSELFLGQKQPKLKTHQLAIYRMLKSKIARCANRYYAYKNGTIPSEMEE